MLIVLLVAMIVFYDLVHEGSEGCVGVVTSSIDSDA